MFQDVGWVTVISALPSLSSGCLSCLELSQGFVAFSGELQATSPLQVALTQLEPSGPT